MRLLAVQGDEVMTAYCTDLLLHEADIGSRIILGSPFSPRYGLAPLPSNKNLVYEDCLHACVPHVPLPPVQAVCCRVHGHCCCKIPSTAQATIIPASPLSPLPFVPFLPCSSPLSSPFPPAQSQPPLVAEIPASQRPHIYKPRVEGQSHREPVEHGRVVAQLPASTLSLSQKADSVQGSRFTAQTRQVVKSGQASGSGQAAAEVQGIGSPQGPTCGVEYTAAGPVCGYLSDASIDSLEDATSKFSHEYSECRGGVNIPLRSV